VLPPQATSVVANSKASERMYFILISSRIK
jgi:hypothetical protein